MQAPFLNSLSFAHSAAAGKAMATTGAHVTTRKKQGPKLFLQGPGRAVGSIRCYSCAGVLGDCHPHFIQKNNDF